jgi:hypothetical protein
MKIKFSFEWSDKVSSGLSFALIMLLSFVVAWMSLHTAQKIIDNPPEAIVNHGSVEK